MQARETKKNWFKKVWATSAGPERMLLLTSGFGVLLFIVRWITSSQAFFSFLPWNLLLAFIPYHISKRLQQRPQWIESMWRFIPVFLIWMLFIPNSFYIITDLFHLELRHGSSRWFDLVLIFTFAWSGLLLGILSVSQMTKIMMHRFSIRHELVFLLPIMGLIAWGVFIGRFMRFNSWDILANPLELAGDVGYMLIHPFRHAYSWSMVACFAIFLSLMYLSLKRIGKVIDQ
jgi:uncharacterized membrane protein